MPEGKSDEKVRFELINNLIVIPMEVNGARLSFILDRGQQTYLFNLSDQDSIELKDVTEISIRGLGDGEPIKALKSAGNTFRLKNMVNTDQQLFVVMDRKMNFSPTLGVPIHGIIGYDLFRDFVVEINYKRRFIKFYDPGGYEHPEGRRSQTLPLTINHNKPYIDGNVLVHGR